MCDAGKLVVGLCSGHGVDHVAFLKPRSGHLMRAGVSGPVIDPEPAHFAVKRVSLSSEQDERDQDTDDADDDYDRAEGGPTYCERAWRLLSTRCVTDRTPAPSARHRCGPAIGIRRVR